jgi:hypothetical protein
MERKGFHVDSPATRKLRIFAFDPSLATKYDFADMSRITASIRWEDLEKGPVGEYIEVIDIDPASGMAYWPVNLDDPHILATDGLNPSEGVPQFHQQMVYAVAMTTINHFERALGRVALWSPLRLPPDHGEDEARPGSKSDIPRRIFVQRLRIYPHALRDENAFYSPEKKALLFGYFPVSRKDKNNTPGTIVFTCLSHDIVAHEVTHALLDGVHPRFNEPTNPDVHAFHEAFADIVALFQHFTYPGVLKSEIARAGGDLTKETLLGQLAQQFGAASGRGGALRDALGEVNEQTQRWEAKKPDPRLLENTSEAHERGAILVAAIFGAYAKIYRSRSSDLFRIATDGTGVLKEGALHPDLVSRLANEAEKSARHVLQMCIRAIDYCPPVDITFGDYLRGLVTADYEYDQEDSRDYRTAFIESFREWGIQPRDLRSMSTEALLWPSGDDIFGPELGKEVEAVLADTDAGLANWNLESNRKQVFDKMRDNGRDLWEYFVAKSGVSAKAKAGMLRAVGLVSHHDRNLPATIFHARSNKAGAAERSKWPGQAVATEVHSVRPTLRRNIRGGTSTDLVVEITQRRCGYMDPKEQLAADKNKTPARYGSKLSIEKDFTFRRGCTLIIDVERKRLRRIIRTNGDIADNLELRRVRKFLSGEGAVSSNAFAAARDVFRAREPFALLHSHGDH